MMRNPWLEIPLEDYEGHMGSEGAAQSGALSDLFRGVLEFCRPASVAVLGVAGGNGLEHLDRAVTSRVVGIDINPLYLEELRRRFAGITGLALHCIDISKQRPEVAPVDLLHASLIFEHCGIDPALENAISLVAPGGLFSVVLQMPASAGPAVSPTRYASMQLLAPHFVFIDPTEFRRVVEDRGFVFTGEDLRPVRGGKSLWVGVFRRPK